MGKLRLAREDVHRLLLEVAERRRVVERLASKHAMLLAKHAAPGGNGPPSQVAL